MDVAGMACGPKRENKVSRPTIEGAIESLYTFLCVLACPFGTERHCERRGRVAMVDRQRKFWLVIVCFGRQWWQLEYEFGKGHEQDHELSRMVLCQVPRCHTTTHLES